MKPGASPACGLKKTAQQRSLPASNKIDHRQAARFLVHPGLGLAEGGLASVSPLAKIPMSCVLIRSRTSEELRWDVKAVALEESPTLGRMIQRHR
eukprot:CAMPEP_0204283682 /NCGR_PEP_ID=MMETSP0468-20130131/46710_1 /ASSEMBLY_ACC=CAM_ASM_000383 /TAXON_ID=2969 /ORGANISM="Oxyrrhis marina" /LENGTH=94 /DNA_ID=CAMNT_0051261327 /DNA_START=220 /DNA_END=504 /DNA_ORIENTATION=+